MKSRNSIFYLAIFALLVTGVVVVLGAYTRLVDAGLGCPDWPTCYGHLWIPKSEIEIAQANLKFSDTPVEMDKTWPEQIHRIFASFLGLIILLMTVLCIFHKSSSVPKKLSCFILALVVVQGLFGMWTVTLKLWPQVVTLHLLGGFTVLSCLWLFLQQLKGYQWKIPDTNLIDHRVLMAARISLSMVILQIALGGWTSSNYAALACTDVPLCQGSLWPTMDFSEGFNLSQSIGPNYLGGLLNNEARTAIHMSHRVGALLTTASLIVLSFLLFKIGIHQVSQWSCILLVVLVGQISLGLSNIIWSLPLLSAVLHNAMGAILLLVVVTINHRLHHAVKSKNQLLVAQGACHG